MKYNQKGLDFIVNELKKNTIMRSLGLMKKILVEKGKLNQKK